MQADELRILEAILAFIFPAFGYVLWSMWNAHVKSDAAYQEKIDKDLAQHKLDVAKNYVTNEDLRNVVTDFNETVRGVHRRFDEFFNRINNNGKH